MPAVAGYAYLTQGVAAGQRAAALKAAPDVAAGVVVTDPDALDRAYEALADLVDDEIPEALVNAEVSERLNDLAMRLQAQGMDLDRLADFLRANFDDLAPHPEERDAERFAQRVRRGEVFGLIGLRRLARRAIEEGFPLEPEQRFGFLHLGGGRCLLWRNNLARVDPLSPEGRSAAYRLGRRRLHAAVAFYRRYLPGMERLQLLDTAPALGVRETRRILGDYRLTNADVLASRRFPDVVCRSAGHDSHLDLRDGVCDIPLGALLPQGVEHLLVAGRAIFAETPTAFDAIRGVVPCIGTGQAAGVVAALAAQARVAPRQLDIAAIQAELLRQGGIL